jgi:hypothetical protein
MLVLKEIYPYFYERIIYYVILRNIKQLSVKSLKKLREFVEKLETDLSMLCKK